MECVHIEGDYCLYMTMGGGGAGDGVCLHRGGLLSIYDHGGLGVECVFIEGDYCLYMTMGGWGWSVSS